MEPLYLSLFAGWAAIIAAQVWFHIKQSRDLYNFNLELAAVITQTIQNLGQQIDMEPPTQGAPGK